MKAIIAGKTRISEKTRKPRGKAIMRGGVGTAKRTVSQLGGILASTVDARIIDRNPAHGLRKPKDKVRDRRLAREVPQPRRDAARGGKDDEVCPHGRL